MKITDTQGLQLYDPRNLMAEPTGRIFRSRLPNVATEIQLADSMAYFVYVGRTTQPIALQYVEFYVSTAGAGTETKEVGLFSTPAATNIQAQTLTKLAVVSGNDIDTLTSTGVRSNSNLNFNYTVPAGIYLWAGIRTAGYSTRPKLSGLCLDFHEGLVLSTANASSFTSAISWSGALITPSPYWNSTIAPDLRIRW